MRLISKILVLAGVLLGAFQSSCWGAHYALRDDLGRRITLPHSVRRIISLAPSVTEILFAVGAQGKLVGDTALCDYPPAAHRLPHVGGVIDPSDERILALRPDLVIVASQTIDAAEADGLARRWHTPVYVTAAADYAGVIKDIAALGALAGQRQATLAVLRRMQTALDTVRQAVAGRPKPRVFVVIWDGPLLTAGGGSFIGDLVRLAGGINVAENSSTAYPSYSPERLVKDDPDIIVSGIPGASVHPVSLPLLNRLRLRAARTHHVYGIPNDWTVRPGPRLCLGVLALAHALHPEAFHP